MEYSSLPKHAPEPACPDCGGQARAAAMEYSSLLKDAPEPAGQDAPEPAGPAYAGAGPGPYHHYIGDLGCHRGPGEAPAQGDQSDDQARTPRSPFGRGDGCLSQSRVRQVKTLGSLAVVLACGALLVSKLIASAPHVAAAGSHNAALQGEGVLSLKTYAGKLSPEALPSLRRAAGLTATSDEEIEKEEERAFQAKIGKDLIENAQHAFKVGGAEVHLSVEGRQVQALHSYVLATTSSKPKEAKPPSKTGGTTTKDSRGRGHVADVGECAQEGESCLVSRCCALPGSRCFRVNQWWAACNATCSKSHQKGWGQEAWDCTDLSRAMQDTPEEEPETPAAPANAPCVKSGEQCLESRCCNDPGMHCFRMNAYWASCNKTCSQRRAWNESTFAWVDTDKPEWDCERLRPNSSGKGVGRTPLSGGGPRGSEVVYMRS